MTNSEPRARWACLLAACLSGAAVEPASAATGGPDAAGYTWADNASGCGTGRGSFGPGAQSFLATGAMQGPFALGFTMPFMGQPVSQIWVSPHGYVAFSAQPNSGPPQTMPNPTDPDHLIAVQWINADDADITVEAQGGSFHVRWFQRAGGFQQHEADLFLEQDGSFRMFWSSVFVAARAIGYENADGSVGTTYYQHDGSMETIRSGNFPNTFGNRSACFEPPRLLNCSAPALIACGETVAGALPAALATNAFLYPCAPDEYPGHERVVDLSVGTTSLVALEATGPADLDLMRLDDGCDEDDCLGRAPTGTDRYDAGLLFPGTYRFVLDKTSPGGGDAFSLSATCDEPFTDLPCDAPVAGDTRGRAGFRSAYSCAGPALDGPEEMYRFSLASPSTVALTLDTLEPDLWVLVFDSAEFEASEGATCLSAGRGGAGLFGAPAGDYIAVVDGAAGAAAAYQIAIACDEQLDCAGAAEATCAQLIAGDTSSSANSASLYNCLSEVMGGGEDVYRFFNPIEQTITASFLSSQPGQKLLLLPSCDQGTCFLAGDEGVSCSLFPPGEYLLVVDSPPSSEGPYEIEILCSEFLVGVDLRVTAIDASSIGAGCEDFDVDGDVRVAVSNLGTGAAPGPFDVLVFEDGVGAADGQWDPGSDTLLGRASITGGLGPGQTVFVDVPVVGTLLFRDNVLHALVDPDGLVPEVDEGNNSFDTGRACEYRPPVGLFSPVVEWVWDSSSVEPSYTEVDTVPLVGDVDRDGLPDIVINTAPQAGGNRAPAIVRALRGDGSGELWNATDPRARVWGRSQLAMADLDGDPGLEIVGQAGDHANHLVAIDDDGSFLWRSQAFAVMNLAPYDFGGGGASIADIDCDGSPEIIFGIEVFKADGTLFWTPEAGGRWGRNEGTFGPDCPLSIVLDVDGDGVQEVVAGPTCYKWNPATGMGEILWDNAAVSDGHAAAGNFDGDDFPEIAIMSRGTMYLLEGDTGALIWSRAVPIAQTISGGPPTVADFDGDCAAEVGTAASSAYYVFETDGTVKWSAAINDTSSHRTASSVFDFEGDGAAEVAFQDQHRLHIFSGRDGSTIATMPASNHTWIEMISIADVDGDNNAEIVQPLNRGGGSPTPMSGIAVVGDADDNWVNTRRIWNQHQYHVSNINDDGTVPGPAEGCERPSWREHNTYRDQIGSAQFLSADITISIVETELIANPDCFADLRIVARVGNGGAINVGAPFEASFYDGDPAAGGSLLRNEPIPDLGPGEFGDFEIIIPTPRAGEIDLWVVADDDGSGTFRGSVNECREDNNSCVRRITNDLGGAGDPPQRVGPALRGRDHGDPRAPDITAIFDWSLDEGAPRPADVHFHVYRSTDPSALIPVSPDPWAGATWDDSTPRSAVLPAVHFYRVFAADRCEQEELR